MKKVKLFFAAALFGVTMMGGGSAEAAIAMYGKVQAVQFRPGTGTHYIYIVPEHSTTVSYYRYCSTDDDTVAQAANNALDLNQTVYLNCSYSAWTSNYGGTVNYVTNYRSR